MTRLFSGAHTIIGSENPDADRAFFREVLGLESVDAGGGWLIFGLPPSEVALHPGKDGRHELYLMCDDLDATLDQLKAKGATVKPESHDEPWGRLATIVLPGGSDLSIYEPRHPRPPQAR
jgi:catechol 2,3-dioxygenase-like lactoylglutathione lyase family enzyme